MAFPLPPQVDGHFYTGDSYILLSTAPSRSGALSWSIHFWLGSETTHDESGIAAYKSVELDDMLGGSPVQYREVQGNESSLFLSYFKSTGGVQYLPGGIASGFKTVERDVYQTRLLHLKGKRAVRVSEVPVALASLNKGDVFILDKGLKIYVFNGPLANKFEKSKGLEVATHINSDERSGRADLVFLDTDAKNADFWGHFGGYKDPHSLPEGHPDEAVEIHTKRKLFRISDESGSMEFVDITPADGKGLTRSLLDDSDAFLLHGACGKIFLWIGRRSNPAEKKEATALAVRYLNEHSLPANTQIERVSSGCETSGFKAEFMQWDAPVHFNVPTTPRAGSSSEQSVDVKEVLRRKAQEDAPVDDGSGKLEVYVVHDHKKEAVDPAHYGQFFGGDSYILQYTYRKRGSSSDEYLLYFWLGTDSPADERGTAALLTVEMDEALGGKPVQVRVTQGKEPAHFRQLFKGRMVVYQGGHSNGQLEAQADTALFHVRGTNALNTVGVQVAASAQSLNSQDCFCLVTPSVVYCWNGVTANAHEVSAATQIANLLAEQYQGRGGRSVVSVREGAEDATFWEVLGGKEDYPQAAPGELPPRDPRLFSASTATGRFHVEEVDAFDQSDLNDEDVFILDTFTQIFVWVGSQATAEEKEKAFAFAQEYVEQADDGRDPSIPIIRVTAGQEPVLFSSYFHPWDSEFTKKRLFKDPYQAKLEALAAEKAKKEEALAKAAPAPAAAAPASPTPAASQFSAPTPGAFSLAQLKEALPAGVDPAAKEEYLSNAEFQQVFGMDRAAFKALAKWKRDDAKKKAGLF